MDNLPTGATIVNQSQPTQGLPTGATLVNTPTTTPIQTAQPQQNIDTATGKPTSIQPVDLKGYFDNVFSDYGKAASGFAGNTEQAASDFQQGGIGNDLKGVEKSTLGNTATAVGAIFSPITEGIKSLSDSIVQNVSNNKTLQNIASTKGVGAVLDAVNGAQGSFATLAAQHPTIASTLSDAVNTAMGIAGEKVAPESDIIKPVTNAVSDTASSVKNAVTSVKPNDLQTIADTISPPVNAKELKLATSQGRVITGQEPTLLRGGTPDQILTSDATANSARVINEQIPNAAKLSQPDLYTALEGRTTDMAQKLQPQMQAVQLKSPTVEQLQSDWENLKQTQLDNADATEEPNVKKWQAQMDTRLSTITNKSSLDDVWNLRKSIDDSTPPNVKNANSLSDARLQSKKEIWLQNRSLLNNVINDAESGLGQLSQKAFADMKAMYDAKANLLSKAKSNFEAVAQPSKIKQWIQAHPYVTTGIVGAAASATGIPKKALDLVSGGIL